VGEGKTSNLWDTTTSKKDKKKEVDNSHEELTVKQERLQILKVNQKLFHQQNQKRQRN
jgi:hypothetical protein